MIAPVIVYDLSMKKVAYLENAFAVGYEERFNSLWQAHFSLPADDPKRQYCQPLHYVEIFDHRQRVDIFRIIPSTAQHDESGKTVTYRAEHVLATLLDDVMFKYHQIGGTGIYTTEVLQYILARQEVQHWQLGTVEFSRQFLYSWENENLLAALFSVPKPFDQEYQWTWDTASYPWILRLQAADETLGPEIRYRRNMRGVEVEEDPTELCTRLYALGYGEGVNQLGIESVNPTGQPYIDADTQAQYGVIKRVWVDRRYQDAESLYHSAKAALEKMKLPRISVTVSAADLYKLTRDPLDLFVLGRRIRTYDEELGLDYTSRVIARRKSDVLGAPGDIELEIANASRDIAGSIADLADRARVNEVYAQGATNLDSYTLTDNCDPENPARLRFHVPHEAVNINRALLNYQILAFRAYSKAVAGGGAYADTTSSGGAYSSTTPSGGGHTSGPYGDLLATTEIANRYSLFATLVPDYVSEISDHNHGGYTGNTTAAAHNHGLASGTELAIAGGGSITWSAYGGDSHRHTIGDDGGHTHALTTEHYHEVTLPDHTHFVKDHTHDFSVPNHSHGFSVPNHDHEIEYGIYQGPVPTAVVVKVDGNIIPGLGLSEDSVDIVQYLAKSGGGKIERGWHEMEIVPDDLGRVEATLHLQLFIQSRGEAKL